MATTDRRRYQDVRTDDPALQRAQEETRDAIKAFPPFMQAVHLKVPSVAAGADVTVSHLLGRAPRGWWIADAVGGPPLVHRTASDSKTITFHNSHAATIGFAFWIY